MTTIVSTSDSAGPESRAASCHCVTKIHFTGESICIQDLRPNHYDAKFSSVTPVAESSFVKSILESLLPAEKPGDAQPVPNESIDSLKAMFDEIRIGMAEEEQARSVADAKKLAE